MLARVRAIGKDLYRVEAFLTTDLGPQWVTVDETWHEDLALELREYVRYSASTRWVARKVRIFEAARRAAQEHPTENTTEEAAGYRQHFDND